MCATYWLFNMRNFDTAQLLRAPRSALRAILRGSKNELRRVHSLRRPKRTIRYAYAGGGNATSRDRFLTSGVSPARARPREPRGAGLRPMAMLSRGAPPAARHRPFWKAQFVFIERQHKKTAASLKKPEIHCRERRPRRGRRSGVHTALVVVHPCVPSPKRRSCPGTYQGPPTGGRSTTP